MLALSVVMLHRMIKNNTSIYLHAGQRRRAFSQHGTFTISNSKACALLASQIRQRDIQQQCCIIPYMAATLREKIEYNILIVLSYIAVRILFFKSLWQSKRHCGYSGFKSTCNDCVVRQMYELNALILIAAHQVYLGVIQNKESQLNRTPVSLEYSRQALVAA